MEEASEVRKEGGKAYVCGEEGSAGSEGTRYLRICEMEPRSEGGGGGGGHQRRI